MLLLLLPFQIFALQDFTSCCIRFVLRVLGNLREVPSNVVHLKILYNTGMYVLQTNRASFNQNSVDPTCMLCNKRAMIALNRSPEFKSSNPKPSAAELLGT